MKKNKVLISKIKKMEGSILGFGISDKEILKTIEDNDKILICNLLDNINVSNKKGRGKSKKIKLNKLRKKFKKKKTNHLICNRDSIKKDFNFFVKDSIYLTKDTIIYYTKKKEEIIRKYSRYNVDIEEIKCSDGYVIIINVNGEVNHIIKELFYQIIDLVYEIVETITNLLLS